MEPGAKYPTPKDFLSAIQAPARAIESKYGIPWIFTATQAAHESRFGNSRLTIEANNLFGVTGDRWKEIGKPVYEITTVEYENGNPRVVLRPFRKYDSWQDSLEDWAMLIKHRYGFAYDGALHDNFPVFAQGLQQGGYATDPAYAVQLVQLHAELEAIA